jgi:NADPH:quinone reductase-like Zn-dependent oxidoreductase
VALRQQQSGVPRLQTIEVASDAVPESGAPSIQAESTYLITGGTGALGQQLAGWLVEQGARHLVLTSRRGTSAELEKTLDLCVSRGLRYGSRRWMGAIAPP